jgi:hypothetical protein
MFMTSTIVVVVVMAATDMTMDSSQSSSDVTFREAIVMPGTLVGNWDEASNPEGTMTRPGWSGGSGNMPVDCQITPILSGEIMGEPGGSMSIEVDLEGLRVTVEGLHADLLGEKVGTVPLSMLLLFETFRTLQPDSLYIGGVEVEVPLGEGRVISLDLDQVAANDLILIEDGEEWTFAGVLSGTLTMLVEVQKTPLEIPLPVIVPIEGTLSIDGGQITMTVALELDEEETGDAPAGWGFDSVPVDFPTVIPPGQTAHLLLSAEAATVESSLQIDAQFIFVGEAANPGDVNGDGVVNVTDLLAVIAQWGPCSGKCNADLDGDGHVGVTDLLIVLENWD